MKSSMTSAPLQRRWKAFSVNIKLYYY